MSENKEVFLRKCNMCNTEKSKDEFYASNLSRCKECLRSIRRDKYEKKGQISKFDKMTDDDKIKMFNLRMHGATYKKLSDEMNIPLGNVLLWCRKDGKFTKFYQERAKKLENTK